MKHRYLLLIFLLTSSITSYAANGQIKGEVKSNGEVIEFATVLLEKTSYGAITDEQGNFTIKDVPPGEYSLRTSYIGYQTDTRKISIRSGQVVEVSIELKEDASTLEEVVVSGTLKEVTKLQSPVSIEVYSAKFFRANPTPTIFEALQNINGVKPQINCSVCNTGDIHINGLEGPYTMVLIDGMPIVSGLGTVYGLNGIPQSLIERVEVVKGPASTLYGSEAIGGLINIITKKTGLAPKFYADIFTTSWLENNIDLSTKFKAGKKTESFLGTNIYNYSVPFDHNKDGFTDVTLQNRVSVFNKWNIIRPDYKEFSLAARYIYENRWGGDMNWTKDFKGSDSIYAETITTNRWEVFGVYQLPTKEMLKLTFSANGHLQRSFYGDMKFDANQYIAFGQLTWNKIWTRSDLLIGGTFRYTFYDDNTVATESVAPDGQVNNEVHLTYLPGLFIQNEFKIHPRHILLTGLRYDYNSLHGSILTPRLNYKWNSRDDNSVIRMSIGNGYRVANVFTEDHAALTGARDVMFIDELKPETSWNANLNYVQKFQSKKGILFQIDATGFYTYFMNKIIPDYETDVQKIIYTNLDGYAVSRGISVNFEMNYLQKLRFNVGSTLMDVYSVEENVKQRQLFSERFTTTWSISYKFPKADMSIDYTGNLYSPMRLPLLGETDPRPEFSPWWSLQNIQISKNFKKGVEIYGGVKNFLNWTPNKNTPFLIARSNDPFDKNVVFDGQGQPVATPDNPYALTFDPTYIYAPNQGIRGFLGLRYTIK